MHSDFWWLWRMRCALIVWILASAWPATAQSIGEVWGNLTIDWLAGERLVYTLDVEPKVQVTNVTKQSRTPTSRSGRALSSPCLDGSMRTGSSSRASRASRMAGTRLKLPSEWAFGCTSSRGFFSSAPLTAVPSARRSHGAVGRSQHCCVSSIAICFRVARRHRRGGFVTASNWRIR